MLDFKHTQKGVTKNENGRVSDPKTELLAIHFFAEQSQWRVVYWGRSSKTELGVAKEHVLPASLEPNKVRSVERVPVN
jgi:hypothetical protein